MLYYLLWYFTIYSFLGWVAEVSAHAVTKGRFINRGFLNGPVCPIYGFGMIIILLLLEPLKNNVILLFIGSVVVTSLLELFTGFILERLFKIRWWDYSKEKYNFKGYICLRYSLLWGVACVIIVYMIHPAVELTVSIIPHFIGVGLLIVFMVLFLSDFTVMVVTLAKLNANVRLAHRISDKMHAASDRIGSDITDEVFVLEKKLAKAENRKDRIAKRLIAAYPSLAHVDKKVLFKDIRIKLERMQEQMKSAASEKSRDHTVPRNGEGEDCAVGIDKFIKH